jgi:hypothetical protein
MRIDIAWHIESSHFHGFRCRDDAELRDSAVNFRFFGGQMSQYVEIYDACRNVTAKFVRWKIANE